MSLHAAILQPIHERGVTEGRSCFAPFGKGGCGGFAFAFDFDLEQQQQQQQQEQEQEPIPLNPPFSKGEAVLRAAEGGLVAS